MIARWGGIGFRLALAAVFLTILPLHTASAAENAPKPVQLLVLSDGSIQIEGKRYLTADALRPKLLEIKARKPKADFTIVVDNERDMKVIGAAILMIQKTGVFPKIGFLTEPRSE